MPEHPRRLVRHGMTLFLVGLFTGLAVQGMTNPRAALAAHLEAVMNGTFLVAVGLAWNIVGLRDGAARITYALLVFGAWANWATTTASAVLGTSKGTPLAGAGFGASPFAENAVFAMLLLVSAAMIVACATIAARLWRREGRADHATLSGETGAR